MTTLHACPGGCGRQVPRHLFACRDDWARLPIELRRWITGAYRRRDHGGHLRAMAEAVRFYQADAPAAEGARSSCICPSGGWHSRCPIHGPEADPFRLEARR